MHALMNINSHKGTLWLNRRMLDNGLKVKMTLKALSHKIESLQGERKSKLQRLSILKEGVIAVINDETRSHELKEEFSRFIDLYHEIRKVHITLLSLLPEYESTKHETWYKAKMLNFDGFIEKVDRLMCFQNDDEVENKSSAVDGFENESVQPHNSISNVPSIVLSKVIQSTVSNKSKMSSTSSARIIAEADMAALVAHAIALKEIHALEAQAAALKRKQEEQAAALKRKQEEQAAALKREQEEQAEAIRRKKEQMELDAEIAAHNAKLSVLQEASVSGRSQKSDGMESYYRQGTKPKKVPTRPVQQLQPSVKAAPSELHTAKNAPNKVHSHPQPNNQPLRSSTLDPVENQSRQN
ncbi:uncharacterized protein LOC133556064 [Nerophis ophidion]|uniref:uncharacterized protein LOC133556064 n=1 Tax=Nerophis ophidion TaxID=159077 RepID=UPI002ADF29DF|nr:uncharacterized protein LOC133556064 [Nerophis ophidion]